MSATTIKFDNLLDEAKWAFHAGDLRKAEELLAEARVLVAFEIRVGDVQGV